MDSTRIGADQARLLREAVARDLRYLLRLRQRMEKLGFPPGDPLYVATQRAAAAVQDLHVAVHYISCSSGVEKNGPEQAGAT